jgi:hypothetical protein
MNTPRNIIAVDRLRAGEIVGFRPVSRTSVQVSPLTPWESIPIKVPARLTISDKVEDGVRLYTAQLVFRTCAETGDRGRTVYRCKTADGKYYLIGTNARPYPLASVTTNHPDNMTDSQLSEVSVNWTSTSEIPYIQ